MSGQAAATRRMSPAGVEPRVLHLFGLSALVVAQPLYDVLARDPEFFVAHRLQPLDIVLLAVLLVLAVPSVLLLFARAAGRFGPGPQAWIERAGLAALQAIFFLMLVKQAVDQTAVGWTVAATAFGIAATVAYRRSAAVRQVLTLVSVGIVLLPLLFLTRAPIAGLLAPNVALQTPIERPGRTPPVVVVVFDQLPLVSLLDGSGDVDTRYPHFSALSHDSVWLRNASSVGHFTEFALPAILTGRYPSSSRLPTADDHPENLFTLVGGTYQVNAFEPVTALCPPDVCERQGSPWLERVTGAIADLAVVYGHLAAPSMLSSTLPTSPRAGRISGSSACRPDGAFDAPRTGASVHGPGFGQSARATSPSCTSCTSSCPTSPTSTCRPGKPSSLLKSCRGWNRDGGAARACWRRRATSNTCSSWVSWTRSSANSWRACARSTCTTGHSSS